MAAADVGARHVQTVVHAHGVALVTLVLVNAGHPTGVKPEARGTVASLSRGTDNSEKQFDTKIK